MDYKKYLLAVFTVISYNDAVKVNMQGSLSFGKEIMDTISHYMQKNNVITSGRRSMGFSKETDVIHLIIKSSYLCRGLQFCDGELESYLNEYIMVLTKSIEVIFQGIMNQKDNGDDDSKMGHRLIFEDELKRCLLEVRTLLRNINGISRGRNDAYAWIHVIKKINVMFQTAAILFATDRLEGYTPELREVKMKLTQKFIISTIIVEGKYMSTLCSQYEICSKKYVVTNALNILLGSFKDMSEDNVKIFIRYVSEALLKSDFYSLLSDVTSNELQIILNDMAYSDNVPAKEVLMTIHRAVEDRIRSLETKRHVIFGRDVELVHVILSDMDHAFGKRKADPFHTFFTHYFEWARSGRRLMTQVDTLVKELALELTELPDDLSLKLINEVRAFLEITVDPEKK